ncbi:MAG: nucleotidyltransferase substrate binding protein [Synergistaceae bacterium]|nr:nucleotidyltransferase substrate binding protein [Synergistaceae bacterium]
MKKLENFSAGLAVLKRADFTAAYDNEFYRAGVIANFSITFELAWKALQELLRLEGVEQAVTGSPRDVLKLGYRFGLIDDIAAWLLMLESRNIAIHIYNEAEADKALIMIRDSFINAFTVLEKKLREKFNEIQEG